ncbi:MAG: hypothetical protein ACU88J_14480 [Gammaproteobacteria bacterium]
MNLPETLFGTFPKIELNQWASVPAFIIDKVQDGKNSHLVFIAERSGHFS